MTCQDCVHYEVCGKCAVEGMDSDQYHFESRCPRVEFDCNHFKPKSRFVELPNDEPIIFVKDNWLMLNMESEHLGEAIKRSVDYLTKNARERE